MRILKLSILLICFLFVVFSLNYKAVASTALKLSLEDMSVQSKEIILGEVKDKVSFWGEGQKKIFTRITIEVSEVVKGENVEKMLTIVQPGGEVGNIGMKVQGLANFNIGEEALLFLRKSERDYIVVGLAQGKISVMEEKESGKKIAQRNSTDLMVQSMKGQAEPMSTIGPIELNKLITQIKEILDRRGEAEIGGSDNE